MSSHKNETDAKPFKVPPPSGQQYSKMSVGGQIGQSGQEEPIKQNKQATIIPRFRERHHFNLDDFWEYGRSGTDPGTVIIFNQQIFDDDNIPIRRGSRRDVNEIIICFQRLGFNIYEDNILTDSTVDEIIRKLDLVVNDKEELKETNCLIIFFLSHGHSKEELFGKDRRLKSSEIWSKFVNCKELENKPKMFIFQACKGDFYSTTSGETNIYNDNDDPSQLVDNNFFAHPLGPDMLLVYATIEGNTSFRNPTTGTWFIQELCKNFSSYGRRDDVLSIITRTIKCVCGNYFNKDEEISPEISKQMPVFVSTLSKKFYLNRNKDRNILLNIEKETKEIHKLVTEIAKHIKIDTATKAKTLRE